MKATDIRGLARCAKALSLAVWMTFAVHAAHARVVRIVIDEVKPLPADQSGAIAIDQTNPVRSSRSTVGTMTELNDHLKLLYARASELFDRQTAQPVRHDSPETIYAELQARTAPGQPFADARLVVTFPVELPESATEAEVEQWLSVSGYTRVHGQRVVESPTGKRKVLDVVADRFRIGNVEKARAIEAIEASLKRGGGRVSVAVVPESGEGPVWKFSTGLHSPESDIRYADPQPALFSFNSAMGACETCRGFGRVIGVDMTPAMVQQARANATKARISHVEFRLGEIESLPVDANSVDAILSNCVINLSPDKPRVLREAFRVLRPGGRLAIADTVRTADLPAELLADLAAHCGCVAGAASPTECATCVSAGPPPTPFSSSRRTAWPSAPRPA